jgi:serine/threonine-protein kinase
MGRVYLGEHVLMRKRVAFKILHKELTQVPEVVARFEREAMAAANIEHPNIASATDFGKLPDGSVYLVLEYVQGNCLRSLIEEGPLPIARALHIARQVASAVAAAHSLGIIHRDLKPENVLLVEKNGDPDFVKVLDFGIAKVPVQEVSERGSIRPAKVITRVGMIFGTPEYMAPEQALGQYVDARADLYAMGIMLFELLSGVRPFGADSPIGILGQQLQGPAPTFAERAPRVRVPVVLEKLIQRLLASSPSARVASAQQLVAALDEILTAIKLRTGSLANIPNTARMFDAGTEALLDQLPRSEAHVDLLATLGSVSLGDEAMNASTVPAPTYHGRKATRDAQLSSSSKRALLFGLFGTLLAVVLGVTVFAWRHTHKHPVVTGPRATVVQSNAPAADAVSAPQSASDTELKEATAAGASQLRGLATRFPNDFRVLVELAKAQFVMGNAGDSLEAIARAYSLNAGVGRDAKLATLLWKIVQKRETSERALRVLESGYGQRGVDILYDLATTPAVRKDLRQTAANRLHSEAVLQNASPALRALLALQQANTCAEKKALLPTVEKDADGRILPELKSLQSMTGCGKRGRSDCYACLRHGLELENAIAMVKKHQ